MTIQQKNKRKFRQSTKWKKFRNYLITRQKGIDIITGKKLCKGADCHHLDLNENNYSDLSNVDHFVMLNKQTHKYIHWLYNYYKKDPEIFKRLEQLLNKMKEINNEENL